jgi:stress-induced-phosphoprotein 1
MPPPSNHAATGCAPSLQASGNAAFSAGQYSQAVDYFTEAIGLDSNNYVYYSNRSAAHASLGKFRLALADAQRVLALKPDWPKGYSRLGAAHFGLQQWDEAIEAYSKGDCRPAAVFVHAHEHRARRLLFGVPRLISACSQRCELRSNTDLELSAGHAACCRS